MATDAVAFVGDYPFRGIADATSEWLLGHMDRLGIERAWVGHLRSFLYRDPAPGNALLERLVAPYRDRLLPVPTVRPGLPGWEGELDAACGAGAPAVRVYPQYHGLDPAGSEMRALVAAAAAAGLAVVVTVRFEDLRQRHRLDANDLPPAAVRALARSDPAARLLVTHADRGFVEEVHFGLTPEEATRVLWDFSWLWGPPEDHLALLLRTVGVARFTLGTGMPLRIPDAPFAKLDLLDCDAAMRSALLGGNLERWRGSAG